VDAPENNKECITKALTINCRHNTEVTSASELSLPAGTYVAEIESCCCGDLFAYPGQPGSIGYGARIAIEYGNKVISNPNLGAPQNKLEAQNLYQGQAMSFVHAGGKIRAWSLIPSINAADDSEIVVEIRSKECQEALIGAVEKSAEYAVACDMPADRVLFYERAWQLNNCCGTYLRAGGGGWIIMQISAGTDASCGGGESEQHDCIAEALQHNFYPALAFPSNDGVSFLGKPTGMQRFVRNESFEELIVDKIKQNKTIRSVGKLSTHLEGILFPVE
jgi:hypothetical protein